MSAAAAALTWQVFQGLLIYVAVAATCYAVRGGRDAASVTIVGEPQTAPALKPPRMDLTLGYNEANSSALLRRVLSRVDELVRCVEDQGVSRYAELT